MLNVTKLFDYCRAPIDAFCSFGDVLETPHGPLIFQDNGANVLTVAHLDTVDYIEPWRKGNKVFCPQLDDRLGAYVLLEVLPKIGIKVDVLLTDSEEVGESTAQYFTKNTHYNWVFSFDRAGLDCVLYEYQTNALHDLMESYGYRVGWGSFSDICSLNLGVSGINFGVGYHRQHTRRCFARLPDIKSAVTRFANFHRDYKGTQLEYIPNRGYNDGWGAWDSEERGENPYYDDPNDYDRFDEWDWHFLADKYGYTDIELFREEWLEYQKTIV